MIDTSRGINWKPASFIIIYHILLISYLPYYLYYTPPSWSLILATVLLFFIMGISITGGYHRYYSHRAYKTHPVVEAILLLFGTMTAEGSALRWSYDHRLHHAHVDTDDDPYSIHKGFWYAHCLWILEKPRPIESKTVSDLMRNPMVMFQHKYYGSLMVLTNALMVFFVGWLCNDYWGAFVVSLWVRTFFLHHFTWFINSLAHTWGDKPFCTEQSAVNNYIISLVTFGEGYHNYHHTYANDYRNGIRWYHFDPTKWTIWFLNKIGLAYDLKQMDPFTINKRLVLEKKALLLEQIKKALPASWQDKKEELEANIREMSERILEKITAFKKLSEEYNLAKADAEKKRYLAELQQRIKMLKKGLKADWRHWNHLSSTVMHS